MAGIGSNSSGGLLGGALAGQQAQNDHFNQLAATTSQMQMNTLQQAAIQQAFDPSGYLISVGGQFEAERIIAARESSLLASREKPQLAPPHVETVERLPRVIELEAEIE